MAFGDTATTVQCPECKTPLTLPVRLRFRTTTEIAVSIDLAPLREHVASHEARIVTELPPTAR